MDLERIQESLRRHNCDGWLFFDHHQRDPLAYRVLGLQHARHVTRRWYYLIPAKGEPRKLVHRIESGMLDSLPGDRNVYSSWQEQHAQLKSLVGDTRRIAMQYSPECAVPYVSMVDAGTMELVRRTGAEIVTSAELIQEFEARLSQTQFQTHIEAGRRVDQIRSQAFDLIRQQFPTGVVDELRVRDFVREKFHAARLIFDSGPIVAVNAHAGNPHYEPLPETNIPIRPGDLVLLDMWAKLNAPDAVYYDITWTGVCGEAPERIRRVFEIVKGARDSGVRAIQKASESQTELRGFEVDDVVRGFISAAGFRDNFIHRTGHSIGTDVHGAGANMDNFETHDDRRIVPGSLFSIEPGLYFEDFGIRLELDVFFDSTGAGPTGEVQTELVRL